MIFEVTFSKGLTSVPRVSQGVDHAHIYIGSSSLSVNRVTGKPVIAGLSNPVDE